MCKIVYVYFYGYIFNHINPCAHPTRLVGYAVPLIGTAGYRARVTARQLWWKWCVRGSRALQGLQGDGLDGLDGLGISRGNTTVDRTSGGFPKCRVFLYIFIIFPSNPMKLDNSVRSC